MAWLRHFSRDRSGLAGADFALMAMLVIAGRYIAMCHGSELGALIQSVLPT
jgi:hypothetical protein